MMMRLAELLDLEEHFEEVLRRELGSDPAHDLDHVKRVVANAKRISEFETARPEIVVPAAWFHDCVTVEKNARRRERASTIAAKRAREHLTALGYPKRLLGEIAHCIKAHSFSAGVEPRTLEAEVVQDADRLDALGAVGLARCFMVGGRLGRPLYDARDPFCRERDPDDERATVDHFFTKLLTLPRTMRTEAGRYEAEQRTRFLKRFLEQLESELPGSPASDREAGR